MVRRIAIVRLDKCKAPTDCPYLCIKVCPPVRSGKNTISASPENKKIIIEEETCIGCGLCIKTCPFDAISIVNLPKALDEPLHRFGRNGFALYGASLPLPKAGEVIGFLGPNGCGKSTVVDILSGKVVPNLNRGAKIDDVVKFFAGKEVQKHFLLVKDGKLEVSVKPQMISDLPPKILEKRVSDVISKLPPGAVSEFRLALISDRKMGELSGGELQRLSIALAYSRKADIYFFDEPSSYLDIKERLALSGRLRSLSEEKRKGVVLVEHDLTLLDSASDLVHVFYGEPMIYGIVSLPKTQRVGINVYLSGYSPDENVRFRSTQIRFVERAPYEHGRKRAVVQSFSALEKRLGAFSLKVGAGKIHKGDLIGILGENGTGKTTLVRMLAGEIAPDSGEIDSPKSLSYKPQYLEIPDRSATVKSVLNAAAAAASDLNFESEVVEPLSLRLLMTKRMGNLSGGEIQRVSIASAMARKADIYLLDEPSANLDAEQRLSVAKFIRRINEKRGAAVMVVDHDILFIDYVSESLMVFSGEPSVSCSASAPLPMREGMNAFLKDLGVTFRRDPDTKRPRSNKEASRLDREQKGSGEYYYQSA